MVVFANRWIWGFLEKGENEEKKARGRGNGVERRKKRRKGSKGKEVKKRLRKR
jgi:hypothetical protein